MLNVVGILILLVVLLIMSGNETEPVEPPPTNTPKPTVPPDTIGTGEPAQSGDDGLPEPPEMPPLPDRRVDPINP